MGDSGFVLQHQGAEAKIYFGEFYGKPAVLKEWFVKAYRNELLDQKLTCDRISAESQALMTCFSQGLQCPRLYFVDFHMRYIIMEQVVNSCCVKSYIDEVLEENIHNVGKLKNLVVKIGKTVSKLHKNDIVHGDLTTSNMLVKNDQKSEICSGEDFDMYIIDFGLSYASAYPEDKCVDLYILERAFVNTVPKSKKLFQLLLEAYFNDMGINGSEIREKFYEMRQREKTMAS